MALHSWLASSCVRHFPHTPAQTSSTTKLEGARNGRLSFQVAMRNESETAAPQTVGVEATGDESLHIQVRRVGYVAMPHHNSATKRTDLDGVGAVPGLVPDPLWPENTVQLPSHETHAFWISLRPDAVADDYEIEVRVSIDGEETHSHAVQVRLHDVVLQRRDFDVTHWFYADAIMDYYGTDGFDARFWTIAAAYFRNLAQHGSNTLLVPVWTPPLDGVKRPTQLLKVQRENEKYVFDWSDVRRYIEVARACGLEKFEWSHLFTQWGANHAVRIYENQGETETPLWPPETGATSETYRDFLAQYLPQLHEFLRAEKLLDDSYFHISDEPQGAEHIEGYRAARAILRKLAPWMQVMDALSHVEYGRENLTDLPVASIETALEFVAENIDCWAYYCCYPRGKFLNRLLDTPLPKIAMHSFLLYRWPFQGFLHWGFNYWYQQATRTLVDPFAVQDAGSWPNWAYGDPFVVYPGAEGPIDSIRWEIFAESLQDMALLQTLGIERDGELLKELRSFEDFPKTQTWRDNARHELFASLNK